MGATDPRNTTEARTDSPQPDREAVRERLDRVDDPELDRSIVELEYVEAIEVEDGQVTVAFVLPTAWCSPAFAWMMATGIRDEVGALPGVDSVTVDLRDHMHGEEITTGVNEGEAFEEVFEEAEDGVDAVRETLDEKARFARQYEAIDALLDVGVDPEQIATLRRRDLDLASDDDRAAITVRGGALSVVVPREPLGDYLEKARATGLVTDADDALFANREGDPLAADPEAVERVRRDARLAATNIEGQAAICAGLHESRNGVPVDDSP